ncbi:hypothetical protein AB9K26_09550 [Psychroserpens sp. XS_ASV72]|uniref:hypothetical protein n=1 Tax=Psychroserpens sp. XS_ASV72 TaxID=3241293 RepID=UPI0035179AC9
MKLKFTLIFLCCVVLSFYGQSQTKTDPDGEKKSIKIPAKPKENDSTPQPSKIEIKPNSENSITKTDKNINGIPVKVRELKPEEEQFSMFPKSKLRDPGEIFEKRYNAKMEDQGIKIKTMPDLFLGDVRVRGQIANIRCRDHEYPDGDMVQVVVNDEVYIPQLLLTSNFKSFDVPLKEGINTVVFIALNQGESGPNTAEFEVYNDEKVLVSSKRWNLLTGVKAKILVIKDSKLPQLNPQPNNTNAQTSEEEAKNNN